MTSTALTPPAPTDVIDLIPHIVSSSGDLALAAERAHLTYEKFIARLHTVDPVRLAQTLQIANMILTFEALATVKTVTIGTLHDLPPTATARLLTELMQQFTGLLADANPPVHSTHASPFTPNGNTPTTVVNILQQMQNAAETVDADLAARFRTFDVSPATPQVSHHVDSSAEDDAVVRLEPDGEAGAT